MDYFDLRLHRKAFSWLGFDQTCWRAHSAALTGFIMIGGKEAGRKEKGERKEREREETRKVGGEAKEDLVLAYVVVLCMRL